MEKLNENDITKIASKIGKLLIIGFFVEIFSTIFLINPLVNLLHSYGTLSKSDSIEIEMIVRSILHTLSLIIIALFIFKVKFKDIFLNKNQVYKLSLIAKMKLTLLFISIALFSAVVSGFIMEVYTKYVMDIPMPETTSYLSIFAILIIPIIEETLYRGIVLNQLKGIGYLFSVIVSSIYFGLMHGIGFLHSSIIGLIFGFVFVLTGNIRWTIIMHFLFNFILTLNENILLKFFSNISYSTGLLIIAIALLFIFLIISIKDEELKELYYKVNIKNIISQFKKDKHKYVVFINEPKIVMIIIGWLCVQLMGLVASVSMK